MLTTRQEKRAKRSQLIHQLQRLEIQHQRVSGADFIISQCEGCEICTKIRAIGEELSPSNVDTCTASGLTVDSYFEMRAKGLSDKKIAAQIMVSPSALVTWKRTNEITTGRMKLPPLIKEPKPNMIAGRPVGILKDLDLTVQAYMDLRNKGMTLTEIAELQGCSRSTLYKWRQDNGLDDVREVVASRMVGKVGKEISVEDYQKLRLQGKLDMEIANMCSVSKAYFYNWKRVNGLIEKRRDLG